MVREFYQRSVDEALYRAGSLRHCKSISWTNDNVSTPDYRLSSFLKGPLNITEGRTLFQKDSLSHEIHKKQNSFIILRYIAHRSVS